MQKAAKGVKNKAGVFKALNVYSTELMHYVWLLLFIFGREFCSFAYVVNTHNMEESVG